MPDTYGYVRTSRPRVSELSGSDPETQRQLLLAAGVALFHIYQDVGVSGTSGINSRRGWHSLDSRLAQGDTLVVVCIYRIGRRWLDTMGNTHDLQRRGVRVRSLADNEQSWAQYLDADPDSPESSLLGLYPGRLRRLGVPTRNWCPSAAVPGRVWRRRGRTARNWELPASCPRSRRPRL